MEVTFKELYNKIKKSLTTEHLKQIAVNIINAYQNKNYKYLKKYISILKINSDIKINKLFALLIKQYHPDKHSYILNQVDEIYKTNNFEGLKQFHEKYFFEIEFNNIIPEIDIKFEENYKYDKNDFGYNEKNIFEDDNFGETNLYFDEDSHEFIDAINLLFFGGLDINITKFDLNNIDGLLDLSDYDISNLNGIENCIYLVELNLSNNNIDKIGKLSTLKNLKSLFISNNLLDNITILENLKKLKELDISFNNLTDISVLINLPDLEYVNIIGNPIKDYSIISNLVQKGVIVIHEHTNLLF